MTATPYYDRDGITIWHADCRDILPTIDPAAVALLLTDPPYGIDYPGDHADRATNGRLAGGRVQASSRSWPRIAGDTERFDPAPLLRFGNAVLWGGNFYASRLPDSGKWLVFDKCGPDGKSSPMRGDAELAWTNLPGERVELFSKIWHGAPRWREEPILHPAQKPVALMHWIIDRWTKPGDLILDPYMGSGPVARAAQLLGRRYIGIELVEDYCKAAVNRLAQPSMFQEAS